MSPLSPEVEDKRIEVNINYQTMACFEGNTEVYFAKVSTGALYNAVGEQVDAWGTPIGEHRIWRKTVSLPLSGGSASAGWSLPAVGWISLFVGSGVAFHSTYWHNNYGEPTSRGCVNASPDDAKWVFRWTLPHIPYDPGDVTVGMPGGTLVKVIEI
jgi:lipoprotein-anchoring transpeptidase ErfK/SrfK